VTKSSRVTAAALAISLAILTAAVLRPGGEGARRTGDQGTPEVPARTAEVEVVSPRLRLLVPAYFYPAGQGLEEWERLLKGGARAPITVVVNPNSGPGDTPDPLYGAIIRRAVSQGLIPIGYVSTAYAKRPLEQVRSDIETWVRFYPEIRGIFFDSQASGPEHLAYYVELRKLVAAKIPREVVVTNPGVLCSEDYFIRSAMDAACVFEYPEGFHRFHLPPWAAHYPPDRFSVLPYRIGEVQAMRDVVAQAIKGRIGAIYVTDASGDNPWCRLPRYWEAEVEAVHRVNQRQAP
jgi:hypothetical protein